MGVYYLFLIFIYYARTPTPTPMKGMFIRLLKPIPHSKEKCKDNPHRYLGQFHKLQLAAIQYPVQPSQLVDSGIAEILSSVYIICCTTSILRKKAIQEDLRWQVMKSTFSRDLGELWSVRADNSDLEESIV